MLSELLGTIWEKHARVIRPELAQEIGQIVVRFAASNIDVNSGTPVDNQWDAQWRFLERLVRETVKEFESRLEPGDDTARFFAVDAANAASMLARNEVQRLEPPRVLLNDMKQRWEEHKQRLALHLGTVAETEFRVIASTRAPA